MKIPGVLLYFLVLFNFTFLEVVNIYTFDLRKIDFFLFIFYWGISIGGLIFLRFFQIKNTKIKNNLHHTFKSIVFLYIFILLGFFISQEFLLQNRLVLTEAKLSGNLAFLFLSLCLLISPLLAFIKDIKLRDSLVLFRKLFGILVFIIFLRHFIDFFQASYFETNTFIEYYNFFLSSLISPIIWSGAIGGGMIILLGVSSNKFSVQKIGAKGWKILHFLVFPIYLITMLHIWYLGRLDWFYGGFTVLLILTRIMASIARRHRRRKAGKVTKYLCPPCGFIYDEKLGDPDGGLDPGTKFDDIPDDWMCPVCGAKKSDFIPYYETEDSIFGGTLLKVMESELITNTVLHLVLKSKHNMQSYPGQYIGLVMKDSDGEFTRSYSIVSHTNKIIDFYITLKPIGRAGKILKNTQRGDYFKITGIYGNFILQETSLPKVFISTGTGLAPIIYMLNKNTFSDKSIVFFGVQKKEDIFGLEKISQIKDIQIHVFLSQEKIKGYNYGRINIGYNFKKETEFYICGNPNMVETKVKTLKSKGYKNIYFEKFN